MFLVFFSSFKVKEYELSEVFHHSEDDRGYEVLKMEQITHNVVDVFNNDVEEELTEPAITEPSSTTARATTSSTTTTTTSSTTTTIDPKAPSAAAVPRGDKHAIMNSIVQTYRKERKGKKGRDKLRKNFRKIRKYS